MPQTQPGWVNPALEADPSRWRLALKRKGGWLAPGEPNPRTPQPLVLMPPGWDPRDRDQQFQILVSPPGTPAPPDAITYSPDSGEFYQPGDPQPPALDRLNLSLVSLKTPASDPMGAMPPGPMGMPPGPVGLSPTPQSPPMPAPMPSPAAGGPGGPGAPPMGGPPPVPPMGGGPGPVASSPPGPLPGPASPDSMGTGQDVGTGEDADPMLMSPIVQRSRALWQSLMQNSGLVGAQRQPSVGMGQDVGVGADGAVPPDVSEQRRAVLLRAIQPHVGKPYVWGGNSLATGVDCSGFVSEILRGFGYRVQGRPTTTTYRTQLATPIPWESIQPGDVLLSPANPSNPATGEHITLYVGGGQIAESSGDHGIRFAPVNTYRNYTPMRMREPVPGLAEATMLSQRALEQSSGNSDAMAYDPSAVSASGPRSPAQAPQPTNPPGQRGLVALALQHGADPELASIMAGAAMTESRGGNPSAAGDYNAQGRPLSLGLYQMHEGGAGAGISAEKRMDPDYSTRYMLEQEFRPAFDRGRRAGLRGEDLATFTYMAAERPHGWNANDPMASIASKAADAFRDQWRNVAQLAQQGRDVALGGTRQVISLVTDGAQRMAAAVADAGPPPRPDMQLLSRAQEIISRFGATVSSLTPSASAAEMPAGAALAPEMQPNAEATPPAGGYRVGPVPDPSGGESGGATRPPQTQLPTLPTPPTATADAVAIYNGTRGPNGAHLWTFPNAGGAMGSGPPPPSGLQPGQSVPIDAYNELFSQQGATSTPQPVPQPAATPSEELPPPYRPPGNYTMGPVTTSPSPATPQVAATSQAPLTPTTAPSPPNRASEPAYQQAQAQTPARNLTPDEQLGYQRFQIALDELTAMRVPDARIQAIKNARPDQMWPMIEQERDALRALVAPTTQTVDGVQFYTAGGETRPLPPGIQGNKIQSEPAGPGLYITAAPGQPPVMWQTRKDGAVYRLDQNGENPVQVAPPLPPTAVEQAEINYRDRSNDIQAQANANRYEIESAPYRQQTVNQAATLDFERHRQEQNNQLARDDLTEKMRQWDTESANARLQALNNLQAIRERGEQERLTQGEVSANTQAQLDQAQKFHDSLSAEAQSTADYRNRSLDLDTQKFNRPYNELTQAEKEQSSLARDTLQERREEYRLPYDQMTKQQEADADIRRMDLAQRSQDSSQRNAIDTQRLGIEQQRAGIEGQRLGLDTQRLQSDIEFRNRPDAMQFQHGGVGLLDRRNGGFSMVRGDQPYIAEGNVVTPPGSQSQINYWGGPSVTVGQQGIGYAGMPGYGGLGAFSGGSPQMQQPQGYGGYGGMQQPQMPGWGQSPMQRGWGGGFGMGQDRRVGSGQSEGDYLQPLLGTLGMAEGPMRQYSPVGDHDPTWGGGPYGDRWEAPNWPAPRAAQEMGALPFGGQDLGRWDPVSNELDWLERSGNMSPQLRDMPPDDLRRMIRDNLALGRGQDSIRRRPVVKDRSPGWTAGNGPGEMAPAPKVGGWGSPLPPQSVVGTGHRWMEPVSLEGLHKGVDLQAVRGTPVLAPESGRISSVQNNPQGLGLQVEVQGRDGWRQRMSHLEHTDVRQGQRVGAGQQIAEVGSTGASTGPHLDVRLRTPDGQLVDPTRWLGPLAQMPRADQAPVGSGEEFPEWTQLHGDADWDRAEQLRDEWIQEQMRTRRINGAQAEEMAQQVADRAHQARQGIQPTEPAPHISTDATGLSNMRYDPEGDFNLAERLLPETKVRPRAKGNLRNWTPDLSGPVPKGTLPDIPNSIVREWLAGLEEKHWQAGDPAGREPGLSVWEIPEEKGRYAERHYMYRDPEGRLISHLSLTNDSFDPNKPWHVDTFGSDQGAGVLGARAALRIGREAATQLGEDQINPGWMTQFSKNMVSRFLKTKPETRQLWNVLANPMAMASNALGWFPEVLSHLRGDQQPNLDTMTRDSPAPVGNSSFGIVPMAGYDQLPRSGWQGTPYLGEY